MKRLLTILLFISVQAGAQQLFHAHNVSEPSAAKVYTAPPITANLILDHDADFIDSNVNEVLKVYDKSGNGRDGTAPDVSYRPKFSSNALNGHNYIYSDGVDDYLITADSLPDFTTLTVYVVASQETGEAGSYGRFLDADGNKGFFVARDAATAGVRAGADVTNAPYGAAQAVSYGTFYTIRLRSNNTTSYLSINNNTETTYTESGVANNPVKLRWFRSSSGAPGKKRIARVLVYYADHTASERAQVESYLRDKYGHY